MENFQQTEKPTIKKEEKNKETENGRLTVEKALLYQQHATEKQGIGFSEEADKESYEEAEALLNELKEKGIVLEGMDLVGVNLKDIAQQDKLGESLEKEVAQLAMKKEDAGIMGKIGEVMETSGIKKIVLLLSLFSVLSAEGAEAASKKGVEHNIKHVQQEKIKEPETLHFQGVSVTFNYDKNGIPDGCSIKSKYGAEEARKMDIASSKMLVDNFTEIVMEAGLKKPNGLNGIQTELKMVRRNFLIRADLYHKLLQNNMKDEAQLVRNSMLKSIVNVEQSIGAKIFDRKALGEILNSAR